ncbi:hypothetical protein HMI51_03465 [Corallococcus coralloides]|nr:hypothetical protein [Corallococcus coralloides]
MTTLTFPALLVAAAQSVTEQPTWFEWVKLGVTAIVPGIITAGVVGWASFRFGRRLEEQRRVYSQELARLNVALNASLQEKLEADRAQRTEALEHLKRDFQDALASKARRAEYLKAQISNLYGPLVYLLELCKLRVQIAHRINQTAGAISKRGEGQGISVFLNESEIEAWSATANRYFELGSENNDEAVKLLRSGWSWLDEDDQAAVLQFVHDIDRSNIEFRESNGRRLSVDFYSKSLLASDALEAPTVVRPDFISLMRDKLHAKQRELSGLTVLHEQPQSRSIKLLDSSEVKQAI